MYFLIKLKLGLLQGSSCQANFITCCMVSLMSLMFGLNILSLIASMISCGSMRQLSSLNGSSLVNISTSVIAKLKDQNYM